MTFQDFRQINLAYELVQNCINRETVLEYLTLYEIPITNIKDTGQMMSYCPWHGGDCFSVNINTGLWFCFAKCEDSYVKTNQEGNDIHGGTLIDLISKMELISKESAIQRITGIKTNETKDFNILLTALQIVVKKITNPLTYKKDKIKRCLNPPIPIDDITWYDNALQYLYSRNITLETIQKFQINFIPNGINANRVCFPIIHNKTIINYGLRDILGKEKWLEFNTWTKDYRPYLYLAEKDCWMVTTETFLNIDNINPQNPVLIVEGPMDLFRVYSAGYYNVIGAFTCNMTEKQFEILEEKRIEYPVIFFDNDVKKHPFTNLIWNPGQEGAKRCINKITKIMPRAGNITPPKNKDPGDLTINELKNCCLNIQWFSRNIPRKEFILDKLIRME